MDIFARWRIAVSVAAAALVIAVSWYAVRDGTIFNFHEYCPLSPLCVFFTMPASGVLWPWGVFFFGALLISALFLRRLFCGWVCPVGIAQDLLYLPRRLMNRAPARPATVGRRRASLTARLLVLAATIAVPFLTGSMLFTQLCPMIRIGDVMYRVDLVGGLLTLLVLGGLSMVMERFFCRFVCPLGLLLGGAGKIGARIFPTITVTRDCKAGEKCRKCGDACPTKIDLCTANGVIDDAECLLCLSCARQCRCYTLGPRK